MEKEFTAGDHIQGFTYLTNKQAAEFMHAEDAHGVIARVNKTYYTLTTGQKVSKSSAEEFKEEYWDAKVEKKVIKSIVSAFSKLEPTKFTDAKLKKAFISLFGEKHLKLIESSIRKQLGL